MHHTLLPESEQKQIERMYYLRLGTMFCCLMASAGLVGIILLFPAYIHATNVTNAEAVSSASSTEVSNIATLRRELSFSSSLNTVVSSYIGDSAISEVVSKVIEVKGSVKITSFDLSKQGSQASLIVRGIAPTRDVLLSFRDRLSSDPAIARVDLPISELTKSSDIPFSVAVTYAKP